MALDGELECPISELPREWCADCRFGTHGRHRADPEHGDRAPIVHVRSRFIARYPGLCGLCGNAFLEGERIGVTDDDDYICGGCP